MRRAIYTRPDGSIVGNEPQKFALTAQEIVNLTVQDLRKFMMLAASPAQAPKTKPNPAPPPDPDAEKKAEAIAKVVDHDPADLAGVLAKVRRSSNQ